MCEPKSVVSWVEEVLQISLSRYNIGIRYDTDVILGSGLRSRCTILLCWKSYFDWFCLEVLAIYQEMFQVYIYFRFNRLFIAQTHGQSLSQTSSLSKRLVCAKSRFSRSELWKSRYYCKHNKKSWMFKKMEGNETERVFLPCQCHKWAIVEVALLLHWPPLPSGSKLLEKNHRR